MQGEARVRRQFHPCRHQCHHHHHTWWNRGTYASSTEKWPGLNAPMDRISLALMFVTMRNLSSRSGMPPMRSSIILFNANDAAASCEMQYTSWGSEQTAMVSSQATAQEARGC